jgi:hypothetical protein
VSGTEWFRYFIEVTEAQAKEAEQRGASVAQGASGGRLFNHPKSTPWMLLRTPEAQHEKSLREAVS